MSDSAFATAAYPGYTTTELESKIAAGNGNDKMVAEVARRAQVVRGNFSVMTAGERLAWVKKNREDNIACMASEPDNGDRFY